MKLGWGRTVGSCAVGLLALLANPVSAGAQTPQDSVAPPAAPLADGASSNALSAPAMNYDASTGEAEGRASDAATPSQTDQLSSSSFVVSTNADA